MMRVLFVHPPVDRFDRQQAPTLTFSIGRVPPLSGIHLASYIRDNGHTPYVIDGYRIGWRLGNIRRLVYDEIVREAVRFKPNLICVTILTANFYECQETIRLLRAALPNSMIVAGGPHPSGEPVVTLEQIPELDGVGLGQGEETVLELADGKRISETDGCVYMDAGEPVFTRKRQIEKDLDMFPFPAWDLIDGDFYSELNGTTTFGILTRSLGILTSRGCTGNCFFCASAWNRPLRTHSPEYILNHCQFLEKRYSIDTIAFWDDTIGLNPKRLEEICEGFIRTGLNQRLQWFAMLRANQIKSDLLELMKDAGCFYVAFGAESACDRVLQVLNKNITAAQNWEAARLVNEKSLFLSTSVILGSPTETESEMYETIKFCRSIETANLGVGRFCPLVGSPSYYSFVKSGRIDPRNVDWEMLGNFGLMEGEVFADVNPKRFREVFSVFNGYCNQRNFESFIRGVSNQLFCFLGWLLQLGRVSLYTIIRRGNDDRIHRPCPE